MDDDQQFCLRWNNHQSTLISQFDTLLENETLVDCTLAAEGKYLRAHKVVLSACSPYFESLLRLQYDKHPIFILKDVKYQELRAMMDYMYRGEVNISQDQLGALLKAAESLQIKGLSDSKGGEKRQQPPPRQSSPIPTPSSSKTLTVSKQSTRSAATISNDTVVGPPSPINPRESSVTPPPRKRKKLRRRSQDDEMTDNHDNHSNSSNHSQPANSPTIPLPILPITKASSDDDQMVDEIIPLVVPSTSSSTEQNIVEKTNSNIANVKIKESPVETHSEIMIEPKAEYVDDVNEDSVEDLTLDDEDLEDMDQSQAGPSHAGEGSSQGFGAWHMGGDRTQDEVFMAAQEATSGHRDTQDMPKPAEKSKKPSQLPNSKKPIVKYSRRFKTTKKTSGEQRFSSQPVDNIAALAPLVQITQPKEVISPVPSSGKSSAPVSVPVHPTAQSSPALSMDGDAMDDDASSSMYYDDDFDDIELPDELDIGLTSDASFAFSNVPTVMSLAGMHDKQGLPIRMQKSSHSDDDGGLEAKFVCRHCGKRYRWKSTLRRHENVECGGKEPAHQCPYCPYKAKQRGNLGVHVRKHHDKSLPSPRMNKTR